jgi:RecA/RadA recombinase
MGRGRNPIDDIEQMFDTGRPMASLSPDVSAALASLQTRWGAAAPKVIGALATAPLPADLPDDPSELAPVPASPGEPRTGVERVVRTGFPDLDAIVGPGGLGLPRNASVALKGAPSSGATTLALRLVAEAQADGAIVAWLDLARALDPVEAVARGVRLDWLVVLTPETLDEGLSIAGMLLAARSVDVLVIDLPPRPAAGTTPAKVADRLRRLAALARRAETLLVALEPPGLSAGLATAVAESTGLRLELSRTSWIRLGRDVVGQRTEALVARSRYGPPGRRAELRILYAEGGERDRCLRRPDLLRDDLVALPTAAPTGLPRIPIDATPPPLLATPPDPAGPLPPLRLVPDGPTGRPRRAAVDGRDGDRRRSGGPGARRPARDPARERAPART